ncbi:hypothetical protein [Clostridium sp. HBUAS56010]|uniref:hypothetical protein n=1 Tax=Clostridium sp. HBUAS56010 TaxID=2571127 RepID=UPI00117808A0|nr:hypothetical protein [Clostridium sp. HBUAS56010]
MNKKNLCINIGCFIGGIILCILITRIIPEQKGNVLFKSNNLGETYDFPEKKEVCRDNNFGLAENTDLKEHNYDNLNTDRGYKILYGEWMVTESVGECYRIDTQDISDVIGKKFSFSFWKSHFYYQGEEVNINYPRYEIITIPLDDNTTYFPYMPTMKEMGIVGNYVTIFIPESAEKGYDMCFMIKDDETLIMYYKDTYLELKRIKHIPDYELYYRAV